MPRKNSPKHVDPRVKRTRRALQDALLSLLLEKDYASISIKEITGRAEVAYITFYRHYESLDQLLMEALEGGLAELMSRIEALARQSDASNLEAEGRLIFEYIGGKADLFHILFKSQSVIRIRKKIHRNIADIFQKSCLPLTRANHPATIAILSNHIATSLLALIEWWLENRRSPAPAQMGRIYKNLIIDSTVRTVSVL
jgi:AcrR family transcriptional regulator